MKLLGEIVQNLEDGNYSKVKELTQSALQNGVDLQDVLNQGLILGMSRVGERFKKNEIYLPEVILAARAMLAGMDILEPMLASAGVEPKGKVAIGTVQGDIHQIGKNLVSMMLKGGGFQVTDLGVNVPAERFVEAAQQRSQLIGMSSLLGTTMPYMKTVIEALKNAGLRNQVKVIVGGAIVSQSYADAIGADGYAPDAASAVGIVNELLGLS